MEVKNFCICEKCNAILTEPNNGVIIQGNIYAADPNNRMGLIGNSFPDSKEDFCVKEIAEVAFCRSCLWKILFEKEKKE